MSEPTITIIMGMYNEKKYVPEAIKSVLDQTYKCSELIIVDDASTDRSRKVVQSFEDGRIELLVNETNQGLTYSLNRALEHASGEYIARQDADDISDPARLERQLQFLERHEDVAVVGTGAHLIDGGGRIIDRRIPKCDPGFDDFLHKGHLIHGSIMARKSVLEDVGGYNEFFRYGQDQELWLRLAKQHSIANIAQPLYKHRIHDEGVYFSRKDESAMYGRLARDLATGTITPEKLEELERDGVLSYYDTLSSQQRASFHRDLATRYLRYGHIEPAVEQCKQASEYEPYALKTILLRILARGGPTAVTAVRWMMRRYLNNKNRIYNRFKCSYSFD